MRIIHMKVLLSYPRSGNHLVRFFIELLSEHSTYGCANSPIDKPMHVFEYPMRVPFNVKPHHRATCYHKSHHVPSDSVSELIVIVRNPREALIRHRHTEVLSIPPDNPSSIESYFAILDYYETFRGRKLMLFYEDIITKRVAFVQQLSTFLGNCNPGKVQFALSNVDALFDASHRVKRIGHGSINRSNNALSHYYPMLDESIRQQFDERLRPHLEAHPLIRQRYGL